MERNYCIYQNVLCKTHGLQQHRNSTFKIKCTYIGVLNDLIYYIDCSLVIRTMVFLNTWTISSWKILNLFFAIHHWYTKKTFMQFSFNFFFHFAFDFGTNKNCLMFPLIFPVGKSAFTWKTVGIARMVFSVTDQICHRLGWNWAHRIADQFPELVWVECRGQQREKVASPLLVEIEMHSLSSILKYSWNLMTLAN